MSNSKSKWITSSALLIALLIVLQVITAPIGGTLLTGSLVNMILIVSVMTYGLLSGITVAFCSPVIAKLIGIGPLWSIIPFIILGNVTLIVLWYLIGMKQDGKNYRLQILALFVAAFAKFSVLYVGIVKISVPMILHLANPKAAVISKMFSFPQLITAILGGILALMIVPPLKKAVLHEKG